MLSAHRVSSTYAVLSAIAVIAVFAVVVIALALVGSPAQQRRNWADGIRVTNLESLKYAVDRYVAERKRLPKDLADLQRFDSTLTARDPLSNRAYGYRALTRDEYELSAAFSTDTHADSTPAMSSSHYVYPNEKLPFWKHVRGQQVFRLQAEKARP